jgi:hypothetical protein
MIVCHHDHPYSSIIEIIQKNGYEIGNGSFREFLESVHYHHMIGILDPTKSAVKDPEIFYFHGLRYPRVLGEMRMMHVGDFWLENEARKAKLNKTWVLEIYGKENLERMEQLADNISKLYGIDIKIKLVSQEFSYESFTSDVPSLFG